MPCIVHLIVYNSPLFSAHWSLWIPSKCDPNLGKRIHAEGNSLSGFTIVFERSYNIKEDNRSKQLVTLAEVADNVVQDKQTEEEESQASNLVPCDRIEEVALGVEPPGKSLRGFEEKGAKHRVEVKNCQTWLREVVAALVAEGITDSSALSVIENAPKN